MQPAGTSLLFYDERGAVAATLLLFAPKDKPDALQCLGVAEAHEAGEEPVQMLEGLRYEYEFEGECAESLRLEEAFGRRDIIEPSRIPKLAHCGSIATGLNTGRLTLLARDAAGNEVGRAALEVRSRKLGYRDDYRHMLQDITEQCVSLLMDLRSPVAAAMVPDPGKTPETINQRFSFLRALIGSRQFRDALHRITTHPHQRWEPEETNCDTRRGFRPDARVVRQLARAPRRVALPDAHPLAGVIASLPERISLLRNIQSEDTPENRFIKFALQTFVGFLNRMRLKLEEVGSPADARLRDEIAALENRLETALMADVLRNVSEPDRLPLGSTVLQRKEGYREVYQAWLKFDMAARLVWRGGDDVYGAGQRDVATLYEYWVFFKLLDIVTRVFNLEKPAVETLIEPTADSFGLKLKTGEHLAFAGIFLGGARPLSVRFSYNRSFVQNREPTQSGSWTERMRPDYTLSLWPSDFDEHEAEAQELMVHVHFDAKYRIENIEQIFGRDDAELDEAGRESDLNSEKQEQREGRYKRADLLKMHAYHDAIRRTHGAYVLYPGDRAKQWEGYREILPGIGAFPMKPGNGDQAVETFIREIVAHTCDRATARERQSYHTYRVQEAPAAYHVLEAFPEKFRDSTSRHTPPAETYVLVGWNKNAEHLAWVKNKKLYNFRMDTQRGSLRLEPEVMAAQYLLLHGEGSKAEKGLLRITSKGPRVLSKAALIKHGYPGEPGGEFYLVFDVEPASEFDGFGWDYAKLPNRPEGRQSAAPFAVTLDAVLSAKQS